MIQHLLKDKTDSTIIQLFRYTIVGGFAFIVDFGSLYLLTEYAHVYYLISAAIAFILGLSINYALSVKWVFINHSLKSKSLEFAIFALIGLLGLAINELVIWFFKEIVQIHYLYSKLVSTLVVYLFNFFSRKMTLFR